VWLFGYYLRAKLKICSQLIHSEQERLELANEFWRLLIPHRRVIAESDWCSLPGILRLNFLLIVVL
jgi:hypothetical protein